jgi:hypothetical protein
MQKYVMSLAFLMSIHFNSYVVAMDSNPFGITFVGIWSGKQLENFKSFRKGFYGYPYPSYNTMNVQNRKWEYIDIELFTDVFLATRYINLKILQEKGVTLREMTTYETYIQDILKKSRRIISENNILFYSVPQRNLLVNVDNFYRKSFTALPLHDSVNFVDQLPK